MLTRSLTHASYDAVNSNERLEFLGDRVLGLIVAEELHARYPDEAEGALALKLNALVRWTLARARGRRRVCPTISSWPSRRSPGAGAASPRFWAAPAKR